MSENKQEKTVIGLDKIMEASLGEVGSTNKVIFRKNVQIKPYETETFEFETTIEFDKEDSGIERSMKQAILQAQLEFTGYSSLLTRKLITQEEYEDRRLGIVKGISQLKSIYENILGKSLDYLFEIE